MNGVPVYMVNDLSKFCSNSNAVQVFMYAFCNDWLVGYGLTAL